MQRQQEAAVWCPAAQLRGGKLVPDPPAGEEGGRAAPDYAELRLRLLDFSQVGWAVRACWAAGHAEWCGKDEVGQAVAGLGGLTSRLLEPPPCPRCSTQVRDMTGDGSVVKRIVRKGAGEFPMDCPLEDSRVRVHYRCAAPAAAGF